ncbi:MAG: hypothetical protein Aurels2KO_37080 [Aureliella sp.]
MTRILPCLLLFAVALTGCAEPTNTAESSASGEADASAEANADVGMSESAADISDSVADVPPQVDVNETKWLSVPEGVSLQKARDYIAVRDMASDEEPNSLANLGFVSQQFGMFLAQNGSSEDVVYDFFKQAASGLRAAVEGGVEEIPPQVLSQSFFFEGVALGKEGEVAASISALDDAFQNGFSQIDFLLEEEALAKVRESDQWGGKLDEWKELVAEAARLEAEKVRQEVMAELAGGEKFAFTMTGTSVDGDEIGLEQLKGKVVIVDFWGTWCPPCRAEIPAFIKLQETYGDDGFQMIGLNYERAPSDDAKATLVTDYIAETGINYPCVLGDKTLQDQVPEFRGYPTTLFIDRAGSVRHMAVGQHSYEYLEMVVTQLLSEE